MPLPVPSSLDRAKNWFIRSPSPLIRFRHDRKTAGIFSNAHNIAISGSQFVDASNVNDLRINYVNNVISGGKAVFELLQPYVCLEATKDSSARHPPPRCHPETRLAIMNKLGQWLFNEYSDSKMLWVRGSAGTGKSGVAQSFGDSCEEKKRHGASYFFSRTTGRNRLETFVPTVMYQLAITIPEYRSLIEHQLANNPLLLHNSPPVQFRELIIKPFAVLQRKCPQKAIVVILDGLDECEGQDAQREILDMITNAVQKNPDLPICWLIFSRPEAHLKNVFSQTPECGCEELVIDAECRENVKRYVADKFIEIKAKYNDVLPEDWPSQDKLREFLDSISGLFVLASTCFNYIDNPDGADPQSQFDSLLTFMQRSREVVSNNPLAALDLLYSRILEKIPPNVYETTRRVLAYMCHGSKIDRGKVLYSAPALSNFMRLDRQAFYRAVHGLHSVLNISEPECAAQCRLQFHHVSFQDFLVDPNRSGKFGICEQEAIVDIIRSSIDWYEVDVTLFHTHDGWTFDWDHKHDNLPGLSWVPEDNHRLFSRFITRFLEYGLFSGDVNMKWDVTDKSLLTQLSNLDFRYWYAWDVFLLVRLCHLEPSTSVVRTKPSNPTDHQLLQYLKHVTGSSIARPAVFPLRDLPDGQWIREYFFIGHAIKSVIVWRTKSPTSSHEYVYSLRCDQEPLEAQIYQYQECL